MPKASSETIEFLTDELIALGQAVGATVPASLTTIVNRIKPQVPPMDTAQNRMKAKVQQALIARRYEPMKV